MNVYNYDVHKVLFGYIHEIDKEEKEGYSGASTINDEVRSKMSGAASN